MAGRYSMSDARFNLEKIHAIEGAHVKNAYITGTVRSVDLGMLNLSTGEIVLADPERKYAIADLSRKTFSISVPAGYYPVSVYMVKSEDGEQIGFTEIRFNQNPPIKYVKAVSAFDAEHNRRGPCGYIVHDNQTGLMDAKVFKYNCDNPKRSNWKSVVDFDPSDDEWQREMENLDLPYRIGKSADGLWNALRLNVKSGCYYWYWGKDRQGNICCLIGDFFTYV